MEKEALRVGLLPEAEDVVEQLVGAGSVDLHDGRRADSEAVVEPPRTSKVGS